MRARIVRLRGAHVLWLLPIGLLALAIAVVLLPVLAVACLVWMRRRRARIGAPRRGTVAGPPADAIDVEPIRRAGRRDDGR